MSVKKQLEREQAAIVRTDNSLLRTALIYSYYQSIFNGVSFHTIIVMSLAMTFQIYDTYL